MFLKKRYVFKNVIRNFSKSGSKNVKVSILGGAGGIGQPLSLMLKVCSLVTEIRMYDISPQILGVSKDLSHIETPCKVFGYKNGDLSKCLKGSDIVLIAAGIPRKPGMSRNDLFETNAKIVKDLVCNFGYVCPNAILGIITNPVNSILPVAAEILRKSNCFNPKKVFGITTLDLVRASTFVADLKGLNPEDVNCPVIAGHSGNTIVPVLSQIRPKIDFTEQERKELNAKIRDAGTAVVKAKMGHGSATLAMAFSATRFTISLIKALKGNQNIIECAMVESKILPSVKYFSTPLLLGKNGIEKNLGLPPLDNFEKILLEQALEDLQTQIQMGEDFVKNFC